MIYKGRRRSVLLSFKILKTLVKKNFFIKDIFNIFRMYKYNRTVFF